MHLDARLKLNQDIASAPNLVDRLTDYDRGVIGRSVWDGYMRDKTSRSRWEERMAAAMDLAMQVARAKNFPWPGAANVVFPLITIGALQFSARAYPAIIQGTDVVRYRVINQDPAGQTSERASRVARHMSWQVLEEDESWEEQHDRLLINVSIVGSAFIKTYFSGSLYHNVSELVMAKDLVIDYFAKSVDGAARLSHVMPLYRNEIYERCVEGVFLDVRKEDWFTGGVPPQPQQTTEEAQSSLRSGQGPPVPDEDSPFHTIEQHRYLDLDADGYAEPYICTIEQTSKRLLRVVARWESNDEVIRSRSEVLRIKPTNYFTKFPFIPSPDGGIYDMGFGAFLGPINEAVSTGINQLLDSGTLQNCIGGFLGRGAKIRGGVYTMAPWEFKRVDSSGDDLRKNIVPFPEKKPLDVTFKLIVLLVEYANRIAGTVETQVGENPGQNTPAETARTMNENGQQVFSMIFKRVWRSMKEEFEKLYQLNGHFLRDHQTFGSGKDFIRREDYQGNPDQIAPVANPNITSSVMRLSQATIVKQASMTTAGYDKDEVERIFLRAAQVDNIDKVYVGLQKTGPLPNYHVQVEEIKQKIREMDIKADQMKWANELLAEKPKMQAEIDKLRAEAAQIVASIGAEKAALQLEAFEKIANALQGRMDLDNDRLKMLLGKQTEGPDGKSKETPLPGGIPGLGGQSGNAELPGATGGMASRANGAMGGGGLPG